MAAEVLLLGVWIAVDRPLEGVSDGSVHALCQLALAVKIRVSWGPLRVSLVAPAATPPGQRRLRLSGVSRFSCMLRFPAEAYGFLGLGKQTPWGPDTGIGRRPFVGLQ